VEGAFPFPFVEGLCNFIGVRLAMQEIGKRKDHTVCLWQEEIGQSYAQKSRLAAGKRRFLDGRKGIFF
jgi:hypothetical protein